jgi:hypothetical protein
MFRGNDSRIEPLAKIIRQLVHQQQLVIPFSNVHEKESLQWGDSKSIELFQFIKRHAVGHSLKRIYDIWDAQLCRAFQAYLTTPNDSGEILLESDALPDDIHNWNGQYWFNSHVSLEDVCATTRFKADFAKRLTDDFTKWRGRHLSYTELFAEVADEFAAEIKDLLPAVIHKMRSFAEMQIGEKTVEKALDEFLNGPKFRSIPFVDISNTLYAKLRRDIQNQSASANHEKALDKFMGFSHDVHVISTYGPYCDAMFVDKQMGQWLNEKDVRFAKKYKTRLFPYSDDGLAELSRWLENIENAIPEDIKRIIRMAYPLENV